MFLLSWTHNQSQSQSRDDAADDDGRLAWILKESCNQSQSQSRESHQHNRKIKFRKNALDVDLISRAHARLSMYEKMYC